MRFRITIARLIAAIGFIGLGLAALRFATELWASLVFTSTLLVLALAATYAAQRRGPRRAFWSAFVAFGVGYMVLAFGPWCETAIRPRLLTTKVLDALYPLVTPGPEGTEALWDYATARRGTRFSPDGRILHVWNPDPSVRIWWWPDATRQARFQTIGHSLFALLPAVIGGTASRYFHAHRDERRREAAEKVAGVLVRVLEAGL
jgi:hypothetical protein